jgi:hypothetical protein
VAIVTINLLCHHGDIWEVFAIFGRNGMADLPIEKLFTHQQFCSQIADIRDRNVLIKMLEDLHIKYLSNQAMVAKIAKQEFLGKGNDTN